MFELGSFYGFVGICLLFTTTVCCRGAVFVVMSHLALFRDGPVIDDILAFFWGYLVLEC